MIGSAEYLTYAYPCYDVEVTKSVLMKVQIYSQACFVYKRQIVYVYDSLAYNKIPYICTHIN